MTQLKQISIRGFKSIKDLPEFELRNLNVLIGANAVGSVTINAAKDFVAGSADIVSATTLTIVGTGTANVSMSGLLVGDDFTTLTINAAGDVNLSAMSLNCGATAVSMAINVTIGSGSTATLIGLAALSGGSAINVVTYTLAGSGNVSLTFESAAAGATAELYSANIDGVALGGKLTIAASASTGIAFNVQAGASGADISLGAGADTVIGGASADTINGGGGNDQLQGGGGSDVFLFFGSGATAATITNSISALGQNGIDVITDMSTADIIRLASFTGLQQLLYGTALTGTFSAINTTTSLGAGSAGIAVFQRGSDVVVQVLLSTSTLGTLASGNVFEVILQGETFNTAFTAVINTATSSVDISNLVIA